MKTTIESIPHADELQRTVAQWLFETESGEFIAGGYADDDAGGRGKHHAGAGVAWAHERADDAGVFALHPAVCRHDHIFTRFGEPFLIAHEIRDFEREGSGLASPQKFPWSA